MTVWSVEWVEFVGGPAADVTSQTITATNVETGTVLFGPTGVGITHVATGFYSYHRDTTADPTGDYLIRWDALNSIGDPVVATEIVTIAPVVSGTWADATFVNNLTGLTVSAEELTIAQRLTEGMVRRVYRASDVDDPDYRWLQGAVAWQAKHVHEHPELLSMADVASTSQDGWSITFRDDNRQVWFSTLAMLELNNLRRGANTSIRMNSAFQSGRATRRRGWPAWR